MLKTKIFLFGMILLAFSANMSGQEASRTGKNPVIVIPGILGSELTNKKTKESVWVKFNESRGDNLDLPISPNLSANRDDLVATDIVEKVRIIRFLPGISVYNELLDHLEKKAGYKRGNWETPQTADYQDTYYVFAYDWRRDNVETAHLLLDKIAKLKLKLKKPHLKFDVVAHSMGGLVTRYAAMYGISALSAKPVPNWSGAKHLNRIFMFGTPNEGSMGALDTLNNGYYINTLTGRFKLDNLDKKAIFTAPSIFQLLPHASSARFFDEALIPLNMDIYDVNTWERYGWSVFSDKKYLTALSKSKRVLLQRYFQVVLSRAKRFHEALDVKTNLPANFTFYIYGSDCKKTLDGAIIYSDFETKAWKTLTSEDSFKTSKGEKIEEKLVSQTIFGKGDGTVSIKSLFGESSAKINGQSMFSANLLLPKQQIVCDDHTAITSNKTIQENFIEVVSGIEKSGN